MIDIRVERSGPVTIAHLSGELTTLESKEITGGLGDFAAGADARLLINLAGIKLIDSEGLSSLITLVNRARLPGGRVVLAAPSPFVANVFHVTRLERVLANDSTQPIVDVTEHQISQRAADDAPGVISVDDLELGRALLVDLHESVQPVVLIHERPVGDQIAG